MFEILHVLTDMLNATNEPKQRVNFILVRIMVQQRRGG